MQNRFPVREVKPEQPASLRRVHSLIHNEWRNCWMCLIPFWLFLTVQVNSRDWMSFFFFFYEAKLSIVRRLPTLFVMLLCNRMQITLFNFPPNFLMSPGAKWNMGDFNLTPPCCQGLELSLAEERDWSSKTYIHGQMCTRMCDKMQETHRQ